MVVDAERYAALRATQRQEQANRIRRLNAQQTATARQSEIPEESVMRGKLNTRWTAAIGQLATQDEVNTRRRTDRLKHQEFRLRLFTTDDLKMAAFDYNPNPAYISQDIVTM